MNQQNSVDGDRLFRLLGIKEYELDVLRARIAQLENELKEGKKLEKTEVDG